MEAGTIPDGGAQAPDQPSEHLGTPFPVAQGAALGLAGFSISAAILGIVNARLAGDAMAAPSIVAAMAFAVGGVAQFVAGLLELRNGSTFAGTAFVMYGMFWMSLFFILHVNGPTSASDLSLYVWAWGIFTVYMLLASLKTNGVVALTLLLLAITFIVLGIQYNSGAGTNLKVGGYLTLVTAIVAAYGACAVVVNETWGRDVLPLFPLA